LQYIILFWNNDCSVYFLDFRFLELSLWTEKWKLLQGSSKFWVNRIQFKIIFRILARKLSGLIVDNYNNKCMLYISRCKRVPTQYKLILVPISADLFDRIKHFFCFHYICNVFFPTTCSCIPTHLFKTFLFLCESVHSSIQRSSFAHCFITLSTENGITIFILYYFFLFSCIGICISKNLLSKRKEQKKKNDVGIRPDVCCLICRTLR